MLSIFRSFISQGQKEESVFVIRERLITKNTTSKLLDSMMKKQMIDNKYELHIMTVKEVALYFRKNISWVYKNWKVLGGRKLRGSLFFPNKEDLYEGIL